MAGASGRRAALRRERVTGRPALAHHEEENPYRPAAAQRILIHARSLTAPPARNSTATRPA